MENVAIIIPAKAFSRRLRGKNAILEFHNGQSLIQIAIRKAKGVTDNVYVTTPDENIVTIARAENVHTIKRPIELSGEVHLDKVVQHAIERLPSYIERVILLQVTNPFVKVSDLKNAMLGDSMGATHCGGFYSQSIKDWKDKGWGNRTNMKLVYMDKSVDIDTIDDFDKAKQLYKE